MHHFVLGEKGLQDVRSDPRTATSTGAAVKDDRHCPWWSGCSCPHVTRTRGVHPFLEMMSPDGRGLLQQDFLLNSEALWPVNVRSSWLWPVVRLIEQPPLLKTPSSQHEQWSKQSIWWILVGLRCQVELTSSVLGKDNLFSCLLLHYFTSNYTIFPFSWAIFSQLMLSCCLYYSLLMPLALLHHHICGWGISQLSSRWSETFTLIYNILSCLWTNQRLRKWAYFTKAWIILVTPLWQTTSSSDQRCPFHFNFYP